MGSNKKKIATNIPTAILEEATAISGLNQTAAIIEGLKELIRREKRSKFVSSEGTMVFDYDVASVRNRC